MKKIILHACCAPCASYPIELLIKDNYKPVVFFYNPNIFPLSEYEIRRDELKKYCAKIGTDFFEDRYDIKEFYELTKDLKNEPEKGKRCSVCFYLRLKKTAEFAKKMNVNYFTTTLTISPHKNSFQVFEQGRIVSFETGVDFIEYNFKKQDGFKISRQIAKDNNMYAQKYCGCLYSMRKINE